MQNLDKIFTDGNVKIQCFPDGDEEPDQLVVFELIVPRAAKVPAPRQHREVAKLVVRPASITSTVRGGALVQLQVSNTALGTAWCTTATLAEVHHAVPSA